MVTEEQILELPRKEKLRVMEMIWSDLEASLQPLNSPKWHQEALKETSLRFGEGLETPVPLEDAKEILRNERR